MCIATTRKWMLLPGHKEHEGHHIQCEIQWLFFKAVYTLAFCNKSDQSFTSSRSASRCWGVSEQALQKSSIACELFCSMVYPFAGCVLWGQKLLACWVANWGLCRFLVAGRPWQWDCFCEEPASGCGGSAWYRHQHCQGQCPGTITNFDFMAFNSFYETCCRFRSVYLGLLIACEYVTGTWPFFAQRRSPIVCMFSNKGAKWPWIEHRTPQRFVTCKVWVILSSLKGWRRGRVQGTCKS